MEHEAQRRAAEALDRYWDAAVAGHLPHESREVGDVPAELIRQLQSLGAPGQAAAQARIWKHLTHGTSPDREEMTMGHAAIVPNVSPLIEANGRVDIRPALRPLVRLALQRSPWLVTQVATAALLLLTLVGALVAFGPRHPGSFAPSRGHVLAAIDATPEPAYLALLWQSTGGPDPLSEAYGIGIAPDGTLWVADGENDRFQLLAPDGTFLETWGMAGSGDGQFNFASPDSNYTYNYGDIAFDAEGNVYVVDAGNYRVQKFAPDRTFLLAWGSKGTSDGQFLVPGSIAVGPNGVVYVSDEQRGDVQTFAADGTFLATIGSPGVGDGEFQTAAGLTTDGDGNVWVADFATNRIQRFSATGDFLSGWSRAGIAEGQLSNPNDVAVDQQGRVYVVETGANRLRVLTASGQVLAQIGGLGTDEPGTFSQPSGIAVAENGTIVVSDTDGIQAFRLIVPPGAELMP